MEKGSLLLIGLAVIVTLAGCAGPCAAPNRVEMDFGTSYKLAIFNQTLNPEAEKNLESVEGLGGVEAEAVIERYRKGFREKPEKPVYTMSIGSLDAGTSQAK